jgi:hypothetical protein
MITYSLLAVIGTAISIVDANYIEDTNDTNEDWLVIEPEEKICNVSSEDWLWIPGCEYACEQYTEENNETLYNVTDEEEYDEFKPRYWDDPGNVLHIGYFMREPKAAFVVIALVKKRISRDRVKDVFFGKNISFGLDERAEQYYAAILQAHNETGFSEDEYPPSGLTVEQIKEIFYIETNEQAISWLSGEHNNLIGRLYYYILLGIYHSWLYPEDAGSAIAAEKDAGSNTSIKIDRVAYQLAAIAYFHNRTTADQCIENCEDLPTDELKKVEMILAIADEPEPTPTPSPTPRRRYDYWQQNPVPL